MPRWLVPIIIAVLCAPLSGCDDYDDFTTSPDARLRIAVDTLRFDTTITTVSTATKSFIVYNPSEAGLRLKSVALATGAQSPFHVNIDGESLTDGRAADFIVRGGDSLMVFVEALMPSLGHDSVATITEQLTFTLESGVQQSLVLAVSGRDGIFWYDKKITTDTTLTSTRPFVLYGETVVGEGAHLTLSAGTTLMFHPNATLRVDGSLVAQGTRSERVIFRGDRTDRMFVNLYYDNTPMRWGGVTLTSKSRDNVLTWADIHSATFGLVADSCDVRLDSCAIHNIGGNALTLNAATCNAYNTQLSNALGHCLDVTGGSTMLTYCTLAQFYPWTANYGSALRLSNKDVRGEVVPLAQAHFHQCVMTGYAADVIEGNLSDPDNSVNYLFDACWLKTPAAEQSETRFSACTYQEASDDITKRFVKFNTTDFLYDFHLQSAEAVPYGIR